MSILKIHAWEVFDSRGNPMVEVDLYTNKDLVPVPSWVYLWLYGKLVLLRRVSPCTITLLT
uniref:Enolase N-terminal domain-containing protein n=1 Tax=Amazona collaria TaxID=241587 RepID=A0A8B9FSN8_9PSIT